MPQPSLDTLVPPRHWSEGWWALLFLAGLPWLLYGWSIPAPFFFLDDRALFWMRNPLVDNGDLSGAWHVWWGRYQGYTPLTHFTVWIDHALDFHRNPWVVRAQNLCWASFLALGLRSFLSAWLGRPLTSFWLTILFIAHPLCASLMLWPAMRRKTLFLAWSCWSLAWFLRAWSDSNPGQAWRWTIAGLLAAALALAGNFHAVILAPLTLMLGLGAWAGHPRQVAVAVMGVGTLTLAFVIFEAIHVTGAPVDGTRLGGSLLGTLLADGPIFRDYLVRMIWPWHLTYYYSVRESGAPDVVNLVSWAVVASVIAVTIRLHPRPLRALGIWVAALACMLPVMNLVVFPFASADHYVQPALVPLLVLAVEIVLPHLYTLDRVLPGRCPWRWWGAGLALIYLVPSAMMRIPSFTDSLVSSAWAMRIQPLSAIHRAYFVGSCSSNEALSRQVRAAATDIFAGEHADLFRIPSTMLVHAGFVAIDHLHDQGRLDEAGAMWDRLEARHPDPSIPLCLRAFTAYTQGDYDKARILLRPLVPLTPQMIDAIWDRCQQGNSLPMITAGTFRDRASLQGEVAPGFVLPDRDSTLLVQQVMMALAHAHAVDEGYEEAAKLMVACLAINPRYYPAWSMLAECQGLRGNLHSAGLAAKRYQDLMTEIGKGLARDDELAAHEDQFYRYRPRRFVPAATPAPTKE